METDAEMQVEVQSALFNMLSGGTAGKGSNRTGKPNTPISTNAATTATSNAVSVTVESNGKLDSEVPTSINRDSLRKHAANGKHLLSLSSDYADKEESLPSASRHTSGISSNTTTPMASHNNNMFFSEGTIEVPGLHPKALANKKFGKDSSFNKVFGSFHDSDGEETVETASETLSGNIRRQLTEENTRLNSQSTASDEMTINKSVTLTDFDLTDSIEYDIDSIKFHSKSKTIDVDEPKELPEITAEDEFGFDAYSNSTNKKSTVSK